MKKIVLILVVVVVVAVAVFVFKKKSVMAPGTTESPMANESISPSPTVSETTSTTPIINPTTSPTASATPQKQMVIITFANGIATPANVTIRAGDTVKFVNNDSVPRWPASGIHPTHQICPGFNALHGITTGEAYSFTFNEAKTCPWHDHLQPSIRGQIVVNP